MSTDEQERPVNVKAVIGAGAATLIVASTALWLILPRHRQVEVSEPPKSRQTEAAEEQVAKASPPKGEMAKIISPSDPEVEHTIADAVRGDRVWTKDHRPRWVLADSEAPIYLILAGQIERGELESIAVCPNQITLPYAQWKGCVNKKAVFDLLWSMFKHKGFGDGVEFWVSRSDHGPLEPDRAVAKYTDSEGLVQFQPLPKTAAENVAGTANAPTASSGKAEHISATNSKSVNVNGYTRKDGTYVQPHTRSAPGSGGGRRR